MNVKVRLSDCVEVYHEGDEGNPTEGPPKETWWDCVKESLHSLGLSRS